MENENLLSYEIPQGQLNTLILQLLIEINSRHMVLQKHLVHQIASTQDEDFQTVWNRLEEEATAFRIDFVTSLYSQFGMIPAEIVDLLKKPPDQNSPL